MNNTPTYPQWLSKKLFLANIGFYATIATVMTLPSVLVQLGLPQFLASFLAFFIVVFIRAGYESMVIYEAKFHQLSPSKMVGLSTITATSSALITYFVKPSLGYFSIPVAIMVSIFIVNKIKAVLWPTHERQGIWNTLPEAIATTASIRYRFFAILVLGTILTCKYFGINYFFIAWASSFFFGTLIEEIFQMITIYKQEIGNKEFVFMTIWSATCAIASTAIVVIMMRNFGFGGPAATITGVITIKLLQPLGLRKLYLD